MPRCRSWRATPQEGHRGHAPGGSCRKCWAPCRDRVEGSRRRCAKCTEALQRHPEERVRIALANETGVGKAVLVELMTDPSARVSAAASRHLAELGFPVEGTP